MKSLLSVMSLGLLLVSQSASAVGVWKPISASKMAMNLVCFSDTGPGNIKVSIPVRAKFEELEFAYDSETEAVERARDKARGVNTYFKTISLAVDPKLKTVGFYSMPNLDERIETPVTVLATGYNDQIAIQFEALDYAIGLRTFFSQSSRGERVQIQAADRIGPNLGVVDCSLE